jgi:hypothetical protein
MYLSIVSLIIGCYVAIIGAYIIIIRYINSSNKQLGEIYETVNHHMRDATIHRKNDDYVPKEVCKSIREPMQADLAEIKNDTKTMVKQITTLQTTLNKEP